MTATAPSAAPDPTEAHRHVTVIEPPRRSELVDARELWAANVSHRDLVLFVAGTLHFHAVERRFADVV